MEKANTADCIVIYGGTQEERQHIAERMIRDHPELGSENNPVFSRTVKIGPFT